MFDLDKLISEAYDAKDTSFDSLVKMVEEMMVLQESLEAINEETGRLQRLSPTKTSGRKITITYNGIPDIPVSELGWASASSNSSEVNIRREQLASFLQPLQGDYMSLRETLERLQKYFPRNISVQAAGDALPTLGTKQELRSEIGNAMSFLIFYKALTEILRNFNESAAGFSFESFLAVLLGGSQVPTGTGTIADLYDSAGTPISLKLLREGTASVGGSYSDLVRDLNANQNKDDYKMHYLVCLKDIRGEGLAAQGAIRFYRYYFNQKNFKNIMATSTATRDYIRLPQIKIAARAKTVFYATIRGETKLAYKANNKFKPVPDSILKSLTLEAKRTSTSFNIGDVEPKYQKIIADNKEEILGNLMPTMGSKNKQKYIAAIAEENPSRGTYNISSALIDLKKMFPNQLQKYNDAKGLINALIDNLEIEDIFAYYLDRSYYSKDKPNITAIKNKDGSVSYQLVPKADRALQQDISGRIRNSLNGVLIGDGKIRARLEQWEDYFKQKYPSKSGSISGLAKNGIKAISTVSSLFYKGMVTRTYDVISDVYEEKVNEMGIKPAQNIAITKFDNFNNSKKILDHLEKNDPKAFFKTLLLTEGYVKNKNWEFSPRQIVKGMKNAGTPPISGDKEDGFCGVIYVGVENVLAFANAIRDDIDSRIFEVFEDLKDLTKALESFYNSGLSDRSDAQRASSEAEDIKTNVDAMSQDKDDQQLSLPFSE